MAEPLDKNISVKDYDKMYRYKDRKIEKNCDTLKTSYISNYKSTK